MKRVLKNVGSKPTNKRPLLVEETCRVITGGRFFSSGSTVVIGVSGGPDSVALVHVMHLLRHQLGIKIIVAHLDHRLRRESPKDRKFVEEFSKRLGLVCVCAQAPLRHSQKGSLEDWARQQRFDFLIGVARRYKADAVLLAHTADDAAETVLMRILRGSGLLGLRGIHQKRDIHGVTFVRPFLSVEKAKILKYLKKEKLPYRIDKTNLKTDFFRNKVRLKLLPLLAKEYSPNIRHLLVNLSESASVDYDLLTGQAQALWDKAAERSSVSEARLNCKVLTKAHPALQRMVLRMAFKHIKGDLKRLTFDHVCHLEALLKSPLKRTAVDLPDGITVMKAGGYLEFKRRS